jgi:ABC-type transport system substrate-binding protein
MNPPRVPASELPGTAIGLRTDTRGMETDVKTRAVWLPLAAMLAGLLLLAGACGGGGAQTGGGDTSATSKATKGGTLRIVLADDTDYVDPALAYYQTSWQFEYSTCLKLLNYPDAAGSEGNQLQPEAAEALPEVSADGKNYTFTVRQGLKFSPPSTEQVTPETFRFVVERALNPKMQSPAASFVSDIQGASDFVAGRAKHVSGIKISGQTISFELTDVAPDFLSRIAMPFFCAIPTDTPIDPRGIKSVPSAGPYFVDSWTPNRTLVIKRNPNYTGDRPAYVDEIRYQMGVDPDQAVLEIKQGNADYLGDGPPPAQNAELGATVGPDSPVANTDKQMFHVNPILSTSYLAMNTSRPHFDNEKVRQAVNFAIDRQTILDQSGKYAGTPSDQILPPGVPGFNDADIYPLDGPDLEKARQLMQESGEQTPFEAVLYTCDTSPCPERAQVIQDNLKAIGITVVIRRFDRNIQFQKEGLRNEPFDLADEGWFADYADPYDFINILLDGSDIQDANNNNFAYFDDSTWNAKMAEAAKLSGDQRYEAYGQLDVDLSTGPAPWASRANSNQLDLFSEQVDGLTFQPIYGMDYNLMYVPS